MEALALTREDAHRAARNAYAEAQRIIAAGKQAVITAGEREDDRSVLQNRYYWQMLTTISQQASINGSRYTAEAFHELGKRMFLGYEIRKVPVAGRKRPTVIRSLRSTRDLSVKQFAEYLEKMQAWAVSDLGVMFSERAP